MNPVDISVGGKPINPPAELTRAPSEMEHKFTSTGVKFWHHREAMEGYRAGNGRSVISTHVAPEGRCNLTCDYCSVSERVLHSRIDPPVIFDYLRRLLSRGLKAVILTGGGEPTLYPSFNELARYILDAELELALITNGTLFRKVDDRALQRLTWLRISMNKFPDWEKKIVVPKDRVGQHTTIGLSLCHSGANKDPAFVRAVMEFAERHEVAYLRVLPDCMLPQSKLLEEHAELDELFKSFPTVRAFHQYKVHQAPGKCKCHQSFFRPYLSEQVDPETGKSGLVFPCDSVVLNDQAMQFKPDFALCRPDQILDYMDGKIPQKFDATTACSGCVFTRNVDMLDDFVHGKVDRFVTAHDRVNHVNFV